MNAAMPPENNSHFKKIIIIGIIILIAAFFIGFWFIKQQPTSSNPIDSNQKNLFPFNNQPGASPTSSSATNQSTNSTDQSQTNPTGMVTLAGSQPLRQITTYPVTGFYSFLEDKTIQEPKLNEKTKETVFVPVVIPTNMVRFNSKMNGVISEAEVTKDAIVVNQKTKTQIPATEEVWFVNGGNAAILRSWNTVNQEIDTLLGIIPDQKKLDYCLTPFTEDLKMGSKGNLVIELQKYLEKKLATDITSYGNFGPKTMSLVKEVQGIFDIPETGIADEETRKSINNDCARIAQEYNAQASQPGQLASSFLPGNIIRGSVAPSTNQLFLIKKTPTGVSGVVSQYNGLNQKTIFTSPFTEWRPLWVNQNTLTMTTLASHEASGYMYTLNASTGVSKKTLGPITGLTTLTNADLSTILYSASTSDGLQTKLYTPSNGKTVALDLITLPEKCTWETATAIICAVPTDIPKGNYPDVWYQGIVAFTDSFWRINTTTNATELLVTPPNSTDGVLLQISPDKQYLYFINRQDQTLWSYQLKN